MIQANELRIGNMVNYQGVKLIVNSISSTNVGLCYPANFGEFQYSNTPIKDIKPIPLTEELLLKCGFVRKGLEYRINSFFFFAQSIDENGFFVNTEFGKYNGEIRFILSFTVESLHDLQNSYYYNSNKKELEMNL